MAIDDNTNYTLTGAQVKDLAQRIQSGGGGGSNAVILYSSVSFHTPSQLVDIYSDAALTTTVTGATVKDYIEAGKTVAIIYQTSVSDVPQNETLIITSCDNHSEATQGVYLFTGTFYDYTNSEPVLYTLACGAQSNIWEAWEKNIPSKTSDLTNDGDDGTHPFLATDDVATVATTGDYNDLSNLPSDRLYRMLVPTGTEITSNKNLNTTEFLVVGRYYCSTNATVATLSNCPTSNAFMMEVFSPLSTTIDNETTSAWCYRLRVLTTYTGESYVQQCETTGTANVWTYHNWIRTDNVQADWNATSGLAQILNKPTIPTVNNATLTIQKNSSNVATFTANASANVTANISVPTQFSDLSGTVSTNQIAANAVTTAKLATSTWVNGSYKSGYKASTNTSFKQNIQATIVGRMLYIRFGVSPNSGSFAKDTEYTFGSIPATVNGTTVSGLCTAAKQNIPRFLCSGQYGMYGWCQLIGTDLTLSFSAAMGNSCGWMCGQLMIPIDY